jgi:hypothetical protein
LIVSPTKDYSDFVRISSASAGDESLLLINLRMQRELVGSASIELAYKLVQRDKSLYAFLKAVSNAFEVSSLTDANARDKIINGIRTTSLMY